MEQSTFEALRVGVSAFVFIAALTAGILLMSSILDLVNFANEQAIVGMNGSLAETVGIVTERVYSGRQILTYYKEEVQAIQQNKQPSEYVFFVRLSDLNQDKELANFIKEEVITNYLDEEFILEYRGLSGNKYEYVFVQKQEQVES